MSFPSRAIVVISALLTSIGGVYALIGSGTAQIVVEASPPASLSTTSSMSTTSLATTTSTSTTKSTTTSATLLAKQTLVIHGTGDVNLDPSYIPALATNGFGYAWEKFDALFRDDDLTVINLECAPSDLGEAESKEFVFRCPTESLPSLSSAGIEVANLANNHSGDYGKEALVDGRAQLQSIGVAPVGVGVNVDEAGEPALFEVDGWTVAVIGFGGVIPHPGWLATETGSGMRNGDDIPSMVAAVEVADEQADIVVVSIHWGVELDTEPRSEDRTRAEALIDAGADVIFGHHAHRLQSMEMVNDAAVFWGLGNFVWPRHSIAGATTAVARAVIRRDGTIEACMIKAVIVNSGQPAPTGEPDCGPSR